MFFFKWRKYVSKHLQQELFVVNAWAGLLNNDQNITRKVRFHVISIVCRRNFINTLKILCHGLASRAEIACRFKVSSTTEENNYKITERNTLNLSSALLRSCIYSASPVGSDVPK